jgi:hypothetical protein
LGKIKKGLLEMLLQGLGERNRLIDGPSRCAHDQPLTSGGKSADTPGSCGTNGGATFQNGERGFMIHRVTKDPFTMLTKTNYIEWVALMHVMFMHEAYGSR